MPQNIDFFNFIQYFIFGRSVEVEPMPGPIVIDHPPKQPRLRDSSSIPIEADKQATFFDQGWRKDDSLFCNECGTSSYKEEGGQLRSGCKRCGYVTYYPDRHFSPPTSAHLT